MECHGDKRSGGQGGDGVSDGVDEGAGAPVEAVLAAGFDKQDEREGKEDEAAPPDEASTQRAAKGEREPGAEQQAVHAAGEHFVGVLRAAAVRDDGDAQADGGEGERKGDAHETAAVADQDDQHRPEEIELLFERDGPEMPGERLQWIRHGDG